MLNMLISTTMFILLIGLGYILQFIDAFAYILCPFYLLLLFFTQHRFQENCKTMEIKDFVYITLFCIFSFFIFLLNEKAMNFDTFAYLYVTTFIAYISFSSSIRYKSLI